MESLDLEGALAAAETADWAVFEIQIVFEQLREDIVSSSCTEYRVEWVIGDNRKKEVMNE